jgi:hypothetical protein
MMPNALMPRTFVHEQSERIGKDPSQQANLTRLLRDQRRLSRFVEENAQELGMAPGGVALYLVGLIARLFELQGGRLKTVSWDQLRAAEERVGQALGGLLPLDDQFVERARAVPRAQPHVLDEALMALFEAEPEPGEQDIDRKDALKVYLILWAVTEALDAAWTPPKGWQGEDSYTFHLIEPKRRRLTAAERAAAGSSAE